MAQSQVDILITAQNRTEQAFSQVQEQLGALRGKVDGVAQSMQRLGSAHSGFLSEFGKGLIYSTAFGAFEAIKDGFEGMVRGAYDSTVAWQGWQFTLESAGLTATAATNQLKFLSDTAETLGINIKDIGTQFSAFITVTQGANIPLQQADEAFKSITEVARVQHLPGQRLQRSIQMIDEMIAMGTAHMQQFRGVLRDWPALMDVLAQSAGISEGRLYDLIKTGQVTSQMLVKWLENMQNVPAVATGVSGAVNSLQASMGRLGTAWFNLTNQANNPEGLKSMTGALDSLASALNSPSLQKGFASIVTGLATLVTWTVKAAAGFGRLATAYANYVGIIPVVMEGLAHAGESLPERRIEKYTAAIQKLKMELGEPTYQTPLAQNSLNSQIAQYEKQIATLQRLQSFMRMQQGVAAMTPHNSASAAPAGPQSLPDINTLTPDKSLMSVQVDGTTKYQTAVNALSHSMETLQTNANDLQKTLGATFKDKHDVEGYTTAVSALSAVVKQSDQYTVQVDSDIQQMVGQTVDGVVITAQMADKAMADLKQKTDKMNEYAKQAARNIQDSFAKFLMDPFKDGLKGMLRSFVKTMDEMAAQALTAKIFAPSSQGGMNAGGLLTQLFGTWLGGASGGAHASGGVAEAGKVSLVGERGPELFVPGMTGTVIPNNVLRASGASHSTAINIDARGAGPDEVSKLLAMRNDIINTVQGNTEFRLQRGSWRTAAPA